MIQRNLHNSNKDLLDLKENYIQVVSKLKEKEVIVSRMKASGNSSYSILFLYMLPISWVCCLLIFFLNRDFFDRPCKGVTLWSAACVKRYKFVVHKIGYFFFPISKGENKICHVLIFLVSADQKDKLESDNQSMLLKFGSQLDQNLKDLHRTVLGSVSQQQQQLRTMEEHTHSFLAHKYDVEKRPYLCQFTFCFEPVDHTSGWFTHAGNTRSGIKNWENIRHLYFRNSSLEGVIWNATKESLLWSGEEEHFYSITNRGCWESMNKIELWNTNSPLAVFLYLSMCFGNNSSAFLFLVSHYISNRGFCSRSGHPQFT